jgi:hypothetical protein
MATPRQTAVCMFVLLLNVLGLNLEGQRLVLTLTDHRRTSLPVRVSCSASR